MADKHKHKKHADPKKDQRHGLNATMAYTDKAGRTQVFRFRCTDLSWGYRHIYDEAAGRRRRSMYPHRTAPNKFTVTATCVGYPEKEVLNAYLRQYAEFAITPDPSTNIKMTVTVPSRSFLQVGVLTQGIVYGDHVASMVWNQDLVFEAAFDPLDKSSRVTVSSFTYENNDALVRELLYFYPTGKQLTAGYSGDDYTVPPASLDTDTFDDTANVNMRNIV